MVAVSGPGSGLCTLRARMHLVLAVSSPGSGLGTLRACMHIMLPVSRSGSGASTRRARMHAQTLLYATTVAAGSPSFSVGTCELACTRRPAVRHHWTPCDTRTACSTRAGVRAVFSGRTQKRMFVWPPA